LHGYGDDKIEEIRELCSIVSIVSGYVSLKKAGTNYVGLCPFHSEKTPSFTVNDDKGIFHCFGCGTGGNVFSFLTRIEGKSFPEIVRELAEKEGFQLDPSYKPEPSIKMGGFGTMVSQAPLAYEEFQKMKMIN